MRRIRTRFFTGAQVYNAVLGEFIARSRHQGLRRCTYEQRDSRAEGEIPDIHCRDDVNYC